MSLEDKVKLQYMKMFYDKFNLSEIEKYFNNQGIKSKNIIGNTEYKISNYFFLWNKINLEKLSSEELFIINEYFSNQKFSLGDLPNNVYEILINNIDKILFTSTEKKYIQYVPHPDKIVPSDAIVFVCHFIHYGYQDNEEVLCKVYDKLNYIQTDLAKNYNMKIAVIPCDEINQIIMN